MFLYGSYKFFPKRVACKNAWCTCCEDATFAVGTRRLRFLHVFFIPVLPLGTVTDWTCRVCGRDIDARRPVGSAVAGCGIWAGALLVFLGLIPLLVAVLTGRRPSTQGVWPLLLGLGIPMMVGFSWIRRRAQRGYEATVKAIEPLNGESCPLCGGPVSDPAKPRCATCDIAIVRPRA